MFPAEALARISVERREEMWRTALEQPAERSRVHVAEDAGSLVGFASVGRSRDADATEGSGELYAIYVLPSAWGRGSGRALMAASLHALRSFGFTNATLCVLENNPRTRSFYERAGWAPDGAARSETFLGVDVAEVRYRISLA